MVLPATSATGTSRSRVTFRPLTRMLRRWPLRLFVPIKPAVPALAVAPVCRPQRPMAMARRAQRLPFRCSYVRVTKGLPHPGTKKRMAGLALGALRQA